MTHRLAGQELLDELVFLLDNGCTAIEAARQVGRTVAAIDVLLRNAEDTARYRSYANITGAELSLTKRRKDRPYWAA